MYQQLNYFRQNTYNRSAAVNYATRYALKPNPKYRYFPLINNNGGDCANFISQCLHAGGAPMIHNPPNIWWYNNHATLNVKDDTWSVSWAVAHSLYWYLKLNKNIGLKGLEVDDLNKLELGDVAFYENYKNTIFHSAIITSFINVNGIREPLISQHSYERLNISYRKSYPYKKLHFLKISVI